MSCCHGNRGYCPECSAEEGGIEKGVEQGKRACARETEIVTLLNSLTRDHSAQG